MSSADSSPAPSLRPPRERFALFHAAAVVIVASWLFGGIGPRGEWIIAVLAAPAFALTFAEAAHRYRAGDLPGLWRLVRWLAPLLALAVLVLISVFNPSHRPAFLYDTYVLRPVPHVTWLPASANASGSLRLLLCFGGLALTGLNLAFCVQSRQALRTLVLVLSINALLLAVFGTLQHETHATGPFFGALTAVNPAWFATFLYHNHWGAFAVLHVSATLALVFHSLRHPPARGWHHGPGPLLAVNALVIAATAPLTSSRSATLLMLALGFVATVLVLLHLRRAARHASRSSILGAILLLAALLGTSGLVAFQSREIITKRFNITLEQIAAIKSGTADYTRADLYADTWHMAADRPVFGWGLESYGAIFQGYSTFKPGKDGLMTTFEDAHSDWLQSLETTDRKSVV